jgi:hypothetical protein
MPRLLLALAVAAALAGCAQDEREGSAQPTPDRSSSTASASADPTGSPSPDPTTGGTPQGSADAPVALDAELAALSWERVPGPASTTVTVSGRWTLTQEDTRAVLDGPRPATVEAPGRHRVTDTLIDGEYAVVVTEDERAQQPNTATVVDLATGDRTVLDGGSDVPTTTGGTWALGDGRLVHATVGRDGAYCLATVDLATTESETTWCAPRRHGFNGAQVSHEGTTLLTFDDQRPSCRTVGRVDGTDLLPFEGVADCIAWDGALLDGGAAWSVVPEEKRIEEAHFFARSDDGWFDLGPGTSGSLTPCGDRAFFVRDPQRSSEPARLMSWSPGQGLQIAYETGARGQAFLDSPRCGGSDVTVTAMTRDGDSQVTASLR